MSPWVGWFGTSHVRWVSLFANSGSAGQLWSPASIALAWKIALTSMYLIP